MPKRIFLFCAVVACLMCGSMSVRADGFIGLYSDGAHTRCSASGTGLLYSVEMWVWAKPDPYRGMIRAEFEINYPDNVLLVGSETWNDPILFHYIGNISGEEILVIFNSCQWDWTWIAHKLLWVTNDIQTRCQVVEQSSDSSIRCVRMFDCTPSRPDYCVGAYPSLWLNQHWDSCEDPIAIEESSWGAIKSLYK